MSAQPLTLYGAKSVVLARATFMPTSTTSGARLVPCSCLIASTSSWSEPLGLAELTLMPYLAVKPLMMAPSLAQSGGSAMTLSSPSFLAAATNESMPPQSLADVAVLALQLAVPPPDVPPQAARTMSAATAVPRWRVKLPHLILSLPLQERAGRPTGG